MVTWLAEQLATLWSSEFSFQFEFQFMYVIPSQ